jgi:hypothetical protein
MRTSSGKRHGADELNRSATVEPIGEAARCARSPKARPTLVHSRGRTREQRDEAVDQRLEAAAQR